MSDYDAFRLFTREQAAKLLFWILLLAALWYTSPAYPQSYTVLEVGQSRFRGNGLWANFAPISQQHDYEWMAKERAGAWTLGFGARTDFGAIEVAYHDLGNTTSFAGYPHIDPGAPNLPPGCGYPCGMPTQWVYHYGEAQALSLSALPETKLGPLTLFARAGAALYRAKFEYHIANEDGDPSNKFFSGSTKWSYYGFTPLYGLGARIGAFSIEAKRFHNLEAKHHEHGSGSWRGVDVISIGAKVSF